jgi:hypothetical protein
LSAILVMSTEPPIEIAEFVDDKNAGLKQVSL